MKLSVEQIKQVDEKLIDYGFTFMDQRLEILDHILCIVELKDHNTFEEAVTDVFIEQHEYLRIQKSLQWTNVIKQRAPLLKDIFMNPIFFVFWGLSFALYLLLPYNNYSELLTDWDIVPMALPIGAYIMYAYHLFVSKDKATSTFGVLFSTSFVNMFYLYIGIHLVRNLENLWSIVVLSFFTAITLMMYYLFFYYKSKNAKKFKLILNS